MTDYGKPGPYEVGYTRSRIREGIVHAWFAKNHSAKSCVCFLNGTGAPSSYYRGLLENLASHGINAICPDNSRTGNGAFGAAAMESYVKKWPDTKVGFSGHSQGGSGAVAAASRFGPDRVDSLFCIAPAWGMGRWGIKQDIAEIKCDTFVMQGGKDRNVFPWWLAIGLQEFTCDVWHGYAHQADHIFRWQPIVNPVMTAWFLWKLKEDKGAESFIGRLDSDPGWNLKTPKYTPPELFYSLEETNILDNVDWNDIELAGEE